MKFIAKYSVYFYAVPALALLAAVFWGAYNYHTRTVTSLEKTVAEKTEQVAKAEELRDNAVQEVKIVDLSSRNTVAILEEVEKLTGMSKKQSSGVAKEVKARVALVEQHYSSKPATLENEALKQREITTIRLNGLWITYCIRNPHDKDCVK